MFVGLLLRLVTEWVDVQKRSLGFSLPLREEGQTHWIVSVLIQYVDQNMHKISENQTSDLQNLGLITSWDDVHKTS